MPKCACSGAPLEMCQHNLTSKCESTQDTSPLPVCHFYRWFGSPTADTVVQILVTPSGQIKLTSSLLVGLLSDECVRVWERVTSYLTWEPTKGQHWDVGIGSNLVLIHRCTAVIWSYFLCGSFATNFNRLWLGHTWIWNWFWTLHRLHVIS